MDRAETVRLLAEVFQAEGYSDRWRTLMDSIREHGPIHDPEWTICVTCGVEFDAEPLTNDHQGRRATRCRNCTLELNAANNLRRYHEGKAS